MSDRSAVPALHRHLPKADPLTTRRAGLWPDHLEDKSHQQYCGEHVKHGEGHSLYLTVLSSLGSFNDQIWTMDWFEIQMRPPDYPHI